MTIKKITLMLGLCASLAAHADVKTLDKVVAIVDDDIIMNSELQRRLELVKGQTSKAKVTLPDTAQLRAQVLERLIVESIQLQIAERAGMRLSDQELTQTIEKIAQQNKMNMAQFKKALEADGVDYNEAREQIRREKITAEVQRYRVGSQIQISEQDIDNFLRSSQGQTATAEEYHLLHIMVQVPSQPSRDDLKKAEARATDMVKQLNNGANFKQMAIALSEGRNALNGGDLGWRKAAELPSIFADVVPAMQNGAIAGPIKSSSGFHIIKLEEKRGGTQVLVDQTAVRHILIKPNELRDDKASAALCKEIYDRIKAGDDFAALAKQYSDDPGSALAGGDLGWVNPGDMVPEFDRTMANTPQGHISKPFATQYGWHILQVTGQRKQDMGQQIQKNQARQFLYSRRFEEELPVWLRQIRSEAYVEIKDAE
jgi:peptidyl-prolyl cis-trans isomerase SurA